MHLLSLLVTMSMAGGVIAQETLRDSVRRSGHIEQVVLNEYEPATMTDLVGKADLVVRVLVTGERARLAKGDTTIVTDYDAQVLDTLRLRAGNAPATLVVTKPGGTAKVEGYLVTATERDFPPFALGEEYILFLAKASESGRFDVLYGGQGAFRLSGGQVMQMARRAAWQKSVSQGRPVAIERLVSEIRRALDAEVR